MTPISPEAGRVHAKILRELFSLSPALSRAGQELLERVSTSNWVLEWGLAEWLSEKFSFPVTLRQDLLSAGISLLAYVRLLDDLADQERQSSQSQSIVLSSALQHIGMRECFRLFSQHSSDPQALGHFWDYFDRCLGEWLGAILNRHGDGFPIFRDYTQSDFERLAGRGALLKLCPAAACLLAGQTDLIAPLMSAIDYLMIGMVMLDEQVDWAKDLEAGRYNVFVAYCSDLPQTEPNRAANRHRVLQEIYLGRSGQPYFDALYAFLQTARQQAKQTDCARLVEHIDWYEAEAHRCGNHFTETARRQLQQAAEQYAEIGQFAPRRPAVGEGK